MPSSHPLERLKIQFIQENDTIQTNPVQDPPQQNPIPLPG